MVDATRYNGYYDQYLLWRKRNGGGWFRIKAEFKTGPKKSKGYWFCRATIQQFIKWM